MRNPSFSGTKTPCCSKVGIKKGPWTPEEDEVLFNYIKKEGEGRWRTLPNRAGLLRCGKSCRLRWMNYLRPSVKRGCITPDEEDLILRLHQLLGNRWSLIAGRIPGRTDNEIKNYWNTHLSKKLISQGIDPRTHKPLNPNPTSSEINGDGHDRHLVSSSNPNPNLPLEMQETGGGYQASGENFNSNPSYYQTHEALINNYTSPIDGFTMGYLPSSHGHYNHEDHYIENCNEDAFSSLLDYLICDNVFVNQPREQQQQQQQQSNMVPSSSIHQYPLVSSAQSFNHGAINWEAVNDVVSTFVGFDDQQNDTAFENHLA